MKTVLFKRYKLKPNGAAEYRQEGSTSTFRCDNGMFDGEAPMELQISVADDAVGISAPNSKAVAADLKRKEAEEAKAKKAAEQEAAKKAKAEEKARKVAEKEAAKKAKAEEKAKAAQEKAEAAAKAAQEAAEKAAAAAKVPEAPTESATA